MSNLPMAKYITAAKIYEKKTANQNIFLTDQDCNE